MGEKKFGGTGFELVQFYTCHSAIGYNRNRIVKAETAYSRECGHYTDTGDDKKLRALERVGRMLDEIM